MRDIVVYNVRKKRLSISCNLSSPILTYSRHGLKKTRSQIWNLTLMMCLSLVMLFQNNYWNVEDIFYALDRAMQEGSIPVDAYLKHVRSLAREQFFHKALAEKVRAIQAQTQIDIMAARAGRYNR